MAGTLFKRKMRFSCWLILLTLTVAGGCASPPPVRKELPPLLRQEEILRPYQKVAVLEVHRTRYAASEDLTPEDYDWIYDALRQEAAQLGADAVIFPQVQVERDVYVFFPISRMNGKATAIRFE